METKIIETSNYSYLFVNQTRSDRYGFTHVSTVMRNNYEISEGKARWINRTWEYYRYETSMKNAVYNLIEEQKEALKYRFKVKNNISRITAKRREELEKVYAEDFLINEYSALLEKLAKH